MVAAGLPVAALGAVAAIVLTASGRGEAPGGQPVRAALRGTEVVERRTLVETEQIDGTLGYGDERPALDRLGGTLTWLPRTGATISPGQPLFAVDDRPVVLMDGTIPAWRTLARGVRDGGDVRQLERNLSTLGFGPGTVDEEFDGTTEAAVKRWQKANDLPQTGRVELGRVVFLPGPRRIAKVEGSLGGGAGSGGGTSGAAWSGDGGLRAVPIADTGEGDGQDDPPPAATTPMTTPTTPQPPTTPAPRPRSGKPRTDKPREGKPRDGGSRPGARSPRRTPTAPGSDTPQQGANGGNGTGADGANGDGGGNGDGSGTDGGAAGAGTEVLSTTSTTRVVTAQLDPADQALARVGGAATVTLPDGRTAAGRIVEIGTVVTDSGGDGGGAGGGGESKLPLTIHLRSDRGAGGVDEAPVSVELARTTRRDVLAVPVAALIARSGGGYAVKVVRRGTTRATEIAVEPGMFADGYVELRDGAVHEGDRVEVPR